MILVEGRKRNHKSLHVETRWFIRCKCF